MTNAENRPPPSYSYDALNRLVTTNALGGQTQVAYGEMGNRCTLTETVLALQDIPSGAYLESGGQVVMEAEHFGQRTNGLDHNWLLKTGQSGYTGTSYLQPLPDLDAPFGQTSAITASPRAEYPIDFTTPGTYTLWLRGYPTNAAGDSVHADLDAQSVSVTGFAPGGWEWVNERMSESANGEPATLVVTTTGVYTLSLSMREDGLRLDRLLLTTDTNYLPSGFGPAESERQTGAGTALTLLDHTIVYTYDNLYRLTEADYTSGENYRYSYDPVGNRLQQIIDGDMTSYQYDAANRLAQVEGQSYTFGDNPTSLRYAGLRGNLLSTGVMTNSWDAANRLIESTRAGATVESIYNGVGDRVGQTMGVTTTYFALDVQGLPEVIYTSEGNLYLHLPGVIMAENDSGEVRYLLGDGLGSIRQGVDDTGAVVAYHEYDPYGNPVDDSPFADSPFAYTGEWWQAEVGLLHLRARWYLPETGTFLSKDVWEGAELQPKTFNGWSYVGSNPTNYTDPSGHMVCLGGIDPETGEG